MLTKRRRGEKSVLMAVERPFRLYLRSRLNLGVSLAAAAAVLSAAVFFRRFLPVITLTIAAVYALATFLLFFSRGGARQIVEENEQDRMKKIRGKTEAIARVRDRLAVLRMKDEAMRKGLEFFLLASGAYIEKCRELGLYSPRANKRIEDAEEICQAFLSGMDEDSTEKRYDVTDGDSFKDLALRSVEALRQAAMDIKAWTEEDLVGSSEEDRLSIIEELEGRQ